MLHQLNNITGNIAEGKNASYSQYYCPECAEQSGKSDPFGPLLAVDGKSKNRKHDYNNFGNCARTAHADTVWWAVDFGDFYKVYNVTTFGNTDGK